ncbi:uncharacterized protein [Acropora muricata]|uniref:uncharacterized protein isoform X2 n=1 Tax=Acropora muricata TaxID=159855 RepID=UPI0034E582F6
MKTKEIAFVLKFQDGDSFSMLKIYSEKINIDLYLVFTEFPDDLSNTVLRKNPLKQQLHSSQILKRKMIKRPEDIIAESLSLFTIMEPPIEIVVVGTGDKLFRLDPKLHSYMRKQHNILLEVQATANASATFNFLLEETRLVGAVLIPPTSTDEP